VRIPILCTVIVIATAAAFAQAPAPASQMSAQKLFEAGKYDPAIQAIASKRQSGSTTPAEDYLAGQIYLRMNQNDKAKQEFARLSSSSDPTWRLIGESAVAFVDNRVDEALDKATQAARQVENPAPGGAPAGASEKFHALYQLGLVKAKKEDWTGAADAFERAAAIDPVFAYAHYYAGLSYSKIQRPDRVALHFDHFLTIAPNAPERSAVTSIMRTIRGR
jgi:tetratricopeptide (TPR) repeat protein